MQEDWHVGLQSVSSVLHSSFSLLFISPHIFLCSNVGFSNGLQSWQGKPAPVWVFHNHSSFGNIHLLQCGVLYVLQEILASALGAPPLTLMFPLLFHFTFPSPLLVPSFFSFLKYIFTDALSTLMMACGGSGCVWHRTAPELFLQRQLLQSHCYQNLAMDTLYEKRWKPPCSAAWNQKS